MSDIYYNVPLGINLNYVLNSIILVVLYDRIKGFYN